MSSGPFGDYSDILNCKATWPGIEPTLKYGELVVLGYNERSPVGETERRRSKFVLKRRSKASGVKKSQNYRVLSAPHNCRAISNNEQHSIAYSISKEQTVVAEYMPDLGTDMFQIGRSTESPIDFVVIDTAFSENRESQITNSTISRFACRILVQRSGNFSARVYAAGFDSARNIFLGEEAIKWQTGGDIDGLTTNGILIMHPPKCFSNWVEPGVWREVSVNGDVYALNEHRTSKNAVKINDVTNELQDGTLIDVCGATLLWRSAEGLRGAPTKEQLKGKTKELNDDRFMCPVALSSLRVPMTSINPENLNDKTPYVYLVCGHVQGLHGWGQYLQSNFRTCPLCFAIGPIAKLSVGFEHSCYMDSGPLTYAFHPCGHMASEKTVKYWASIPIPTNNFNAACPFCATTLSKDQSYTKLIFQDNIYN